MQRLIPARFIIGCISMALLFTNQRAFSQNKSLDYGAIKGKNVSACSDTSRKAICKSKNQLEIWLTDARRMSGTFTTVTVSYDGINWKAIKHEGDWINNKVQVLEVVPVTSFDSIFAALKQNKVFLLPDQKELTVNGAVEDGNEYILSFKAGNKFRSYEFSNPGLFQLYNKDVKEFGNYSAIVEILFNEMKPAQ